MSTSNVPGQSSTFNIPGQRTTHRVLMCDDAYGSPESPLSKMDILTVGEKTETIQLLFTQQTMNECNLKIVHNSFRFVFRSR